MGKFKFFIVSLMILMACSAVYGQDGLTERDSRFWVRPKLIIPSGLPKFGDVTVTWWRYNGQTYTKSVSFDFRYNAGHYGNYSIDVIGMSDPSWPITMKVTVMLGGSIYNGDGSVTQTYNHYKSENSFWGAPVDVTISHFVVIPRFGDT